MYRKLFSVLLFLCLIVTGVMAQRPHKNHRSNNNNRVDSAYEEQMMLIKEHVRRTKELRDRLKNMNLRIASLEEALIDCRISHIADTIHSEQINQLKDQLSRAVFRIAQLENEMLDKIEVSEDQIGNFPDIEGEYNRTNQRISELEYELEDCRNLSDF